jgi:hypothetical protein
MTCESVYIRAMGYWLNNTAARPPHVVEIRPNMEKSAFQDSVREWVRLDSTIGGCWGEYQQEIGTITECTMYFDDPDTAFEFKMKFG